MIFATLFGILGLAALIGILAGIEYTGPVVVRSGNKHITMDHIFNGTFRVDSLAINWVKEGKSFPAHVHLTVADGSQLLMERSLKWIKITISCSRRYIIRHIPRSSSMPAPSKMKLEINYIGLVGHFLPIWNTSFSKQTTSNNGDILLMAITGFIDDLTLRLSLSSCPLHLHSSPKSYGRL